MDHHTHRIVCLVPSITEILYALQLDTEVIGITRYCVHPAAWMNHKQMIGGTKDPKVQEIIDLQPTLVIANDEENRKVDVMALRQAGCHVYVSHIENFSELVQCISDLGDLLNRNAEAQHVISTLRTHHQSTSQMLGGMQTSPLKVAYLIWRKPYMAVAQNTWIDHLLNHLGCVNVCAHLSRYPVIDITQLQSWDIDCILLSSEPYSFKEKHRIEMNAINPKAQVILVDGEVFSWYGPRFLSLGTEAMRIRSLLCHLLE